MEDELEFCFYCKDTYTALERDHVRPISYESARRHYDPADTVLCCRECNRLLGDIPVFTVEERSAYLAETLARKYKKVISTAPWSDEELEELGPRMRSTVEANMRHREWVAKRISSLNKTAHGDFDASHLRGVVTLDQAKAYRILTFYISDMDIHENKIKRLLIEKFDVEEYLISRLLSEKEYYSVATSIKYERGLPLDIPIRKLRRYLMHKRCNT